MSRLAEKLSQQQFVVTAEIAPPKGVDVGPALAKAELLRDMDAINITDNQGACMRMSPLALAGQLVQHGYQPILQITCRDRNRMALQSDLLGASALGIENLLLLTGDHPKFGDHKASCPVFDLDSVQLLQAVSGLEHGVDMAGKKLSQPPQFFSGAAVAPAAEPQLLTLKKFKKKVACGARFFQTQAVFERTKLESFMAEARLYQVPVILGVLLLKNVRMADFLNRNIPGVQVPQDLLQRLEDAPDSLQEGVAIAREMVALAREFCQGVHLMTFGHEDLIPQILAG
ncbi:5,10-methylenetetrahydrofolate reductase [Malonomonas rubra DSM 5091]|uniref:Methylenetetrahydrofolate reductase n=1 Tax=Malonomonas rubra DSM 5091 TaxID=1122189 RepID=A0A1M6BE20_MALRU|nr:methylenetetrahydrofolate reductase [Malonomonas rubra]SHI46808.1 5,10-methylenetetrahydrofolate reductase [Malonomonas rubra DSM 5091]